MPLQIALDTRRIADFGIGTYIRNLVWALARIDADRCPNSEVVFVNCRMGPQVPPAGWQVTGTNLAGLGFREFHSTDLDGKPLDVSRRHPASRQLDAAEAAAVSDAARIFGRESPWNPARR